MLWWVGAIIKNNKRIILWTPLFFTMRIPHSYVASYPHQIFSRWASSSPTFYLPSVHIHPCSTKTKNIPTDHPCSNLNLNQSFLHLFSPNSLPFYLLFILLGPTSIPPNLLFILFKPIPPHLIFTLLRSNLIPPCKSISSFNFFYEEDDINVSLEQIIHFSNLCVQFCYHYHKYELYPKVLNCLKK